MTSVRNKEPDVLGVCVAGGGGVAWEGERRKTKTITTTGTTERSNMSKRLDKELETTL